MSDEAEKLALQEQQLEDSQHAESKEEAKGGKK